MSRTRLVSTAVTAALAVAALAGACSPAPEAPVDTTTQTPQDTTTAPQPTAEPIVTQLRTFTGGDARIDNTRGGTYHQVVMAAAGTSILTAPQANSTGTVTIVDRSTGELLLTSEPRDLNQVHDVRTLPDGYLVHSSYREQAGLATTMTALITLYGADGTLLWEWAYQNDIDATAFKPVVANIDTQGSTVLVENNSTLYGTDLQTGTPLWSTPIGDAHLVPNDVTTHAPAVIVGGSGEPLTGLNPATGTASWQTTLPDGFRAEEYFLTGDAAALEGVTVGVAGQRELTVAMEDGTILQDRDVSAASTTTTAANGFLRYADGGGYAMFDRTGAQLWTTPSGSQWTGLQDVLYTLAGTQVVLVDATTGAQLAYAEIGSDPDRLYAMPSAALIFLEREAEGITAVLW